MKSGQPHQRYQANEKAKKKERERLERERRLRREIQVTGREKQLKAVQRMKNLQKKAEDGRNEKADEERKGKGGVGRKGGDKEAGTGKKKSDAPKGKRKEEKQEEKRAKLARLDFLREGLFMLRIYTFIHDFCEMCAFLGLFGADFYADI